MSIVKSSTNTRMGFVLSRLRKLPTERTHDSEAGRRPFQYDLSMGSAMWCQHIVAKLELLSNASVA
jgi:hypothetical protein